MIKYSYIEKLLDVITLTQSKLSYAQCGEDLIIDFILQRIVPGVPTYLDIGAHHPVHISNTYLFYRRGGRGVCIEPDASLFNEFKKYRTRDICLNVGVGVSEQKKADFYVMSTKSLSTFSKSEAMRYESYGNQKIEKVIHIDLVDINKIFENYFMKEPDFISIDVEGMDFEILSAIDFSKYRPPVICIETLTYTEDRSEEKCPRTSSFMASKGYFPYADTYVNTIFVDRKKWQNRN